MNILQFGEKGKDDKWYLNDKNIRVKTNENVIMFLWHQWSINPTADRCDDENYTIFKVDESNPLNI